ncbi:CDP-glycerol:poly(glycerophosphate) glycerophosphotransferase [Leucobacter luti]|uniref:CDP-glycerol:poly(Glycerophosphate) glycerophosphotransferase n=1 Tax=Leucobacter luti TaxID=340320 RepID=A0A4R6RXE1_9MICO|nr:glycosyltransferase [Leucobacter luti]TDP91005.1 CDP-glycerol:poly(glycerophosphate) glycerophosphotransferase [Leucobacter luti]
MRPVRFPFARALRRLTGDRWDRAFVELTSQKPSTSELRAGTDPAIVRLEALIAADATGIAPVLEWADREHGAAAASASADRIADVSAVSASALVELAHFRYGREQYLVGDELLERAKHLDPDLPAIYAEEADNQRRRSNVHREIRAVERCIELASDSGEVFAWEIWLGQALLRRQDPVAAWRYLARFKDLDAGDERVFSAASCARQLGYQEQADAALHHASPNDAGGIDRERAARAYLTHFPSVEDAEWVLSPRQAPLGSDSDTRLLELGAQAALRAGRTDTALSRIAWAARRPDRGSWVTGFHGMLLELLDRPNEALDAYRSDQQPGALERFRVGSLLEQLSSPREAVEWILSQSATPPRDWAKLRGGEVDPALRALLLRGPARRDFASTDSRTERGDAEYRADELRLLTQAASSTALRAQAAWALARLEAANGEWESAWRSVVAAQDLRLPALPFTELDRLTGEISPEVRYAEFCESEAIDSRTVLYESSLGSATSGDPFALCCQLLSAPSTADLHHVWSITSAASIHPALLGKPNVTFVRKGSPGYFRVLATAGSLVTNAPLPTEFIKREGQRLVCVWQGTAWEPHGRDQAMPTRHGNVTRNFLHADAIVCTDPATLASLPRAFDVDELNPEAFVLAEAPRLELTRAFSESRITHVRTELGVAAGDHLVLYAPHFPAMELSEQVAVAIRVAETLVSGGVHVVITATARLERELSEATLPDGASLRAPDTDPNELLRATDVLVSEGAALLSDALSLGLPAVALGELPGYQGRSVSSAAVARDLLPDLLNHSTDADSTAPTLRGRPCSAVELVLAPRRQETHAAVSTTQHGATRTLLVSTDGFPENGITQSLRSLLTNLATTNCSPYLRPWPGALTHADPALRAEIFAHARVLIGVGQPAGTRMEQEALRFFTSRHYVDAPFIRDFVQAERQREGHRRFGGATFDSAVEFTGYLSSSLALTAYGVPVRGKRGVIFHNEMWREIQTKYPQLRAGMQILDAYDFIASVSDGVRDANAEALAEHLGQSRDQHITIENTIDVPRIRTLAATRLSQEEQAWYRLPGRHACVVARMSPEKNHAALLHVLAEQRHRLTPPVRLTFLGDGPLRADLERLSGTLGLTDLVRFAGHVPAPQAHLRAADALLLPSLHEGQPLVILEALTVGTPVVATATPGSRSALEYGALGVLVPLDDAGLATALERISTGDLVPATEFDADAFTAQSLRQLFTALGFTEVGTATSV